MATYKSIRYSTPLSNGGSRVLLETATASSSATLSFTGGIDSTYKEYLFEFINLHPASDDINFLFQANAAGETGFNETIASTHFRSTHGEDGSSAGLAYLTSADQANGTAYQLLAGSIGNDNDQGVSGELVIYNPSSTTFVKHFTGSFNSIAHSNRTNNQFPAGYFNITAALEQFSFKFSSGNIDAGIIKMYGIN